MNMNYPPGLRDHEARMDREQALEVAAEPLAGELLDTVTDTARTYLADLSLHEQTLAEAEARKALKAWAQSWAESLVEARAREAEPVGGWERA